MDQDSLSLTQRNATERDIDCLHSWFHSIEAIRDWGGPLMEYPITRANLSEQLALHRLQSLALVTNKNQLVAFGQCYSRLEKHHLARLAVAPSHRGCGLGRILVERLLRIGFDDGYQQSSLFVMANNVIAQRLYQSLGFRIEPYPELLTDQLEHCLYMVRSK